MQLETRDEGRGSQAIEIRRAGRQDLVDIVRLVEQASNSHLAVDEARAREWLYSKGLWLALAGERPVGVAAWQVENLLCNADLLNEEPACKR